jgi:hypothetical protein
MTIRQAFAVAGIACAFAAAPGAAAGELTPYPVPPRPAYPPQVSTGYSSPVQTSAPSVAPETYYRFQMEAAKLPSGERGALARKLEEARQGARSSGDVERELHYVKLINILQATK